MKQERYTVWGVDRAGTPWDIESFDNPLHALRRFWVEYNATQPKPFKVGGEVFRANRIITLGIYDNENEERGDIAYELDDCYCGTNSGGLRCYTPLDEEGLCAFRGFHESESSE